MSTNAVAEKTTKAPAPRQEPQGRLYELLEGMHVQYGPLGNDKGDGPGPNHIYRKGDVFRSTSNLLARNAERGRPKFKLHLTDPSREAIRETGPVSETVSLSDLAGMSLVQLRELADVRKIDVGGLVTTDDVLTKIRAELGI